MKPKVVFTNVSKKYSLYKKKSDKLIQLITNKGETRTFYALKDISFEVNEGESIGVIGTNGSGKSTLSNLLAGVIPPTEGTININGETSLIAINVGLNNNITGLENIELKCLMHGLDKTIIKELTPKIIEFADIGDFIDQPVKNYSSGMKSRLGFAISVHTDPDILVVDEALSVGDQTFYEKCLKKIGEFKSEGKTIFFISHSLSQIKNISDRVLWLNYGEIEEFGETIPVVTHYNDYVKWFNSLSDVEKKEYKTKKLQERKQDKNIIGVTRGVRGKRKNNNKEPNAFFQVQMISLILVTLILGILMFTHGSMNISTLINSAKSEITYKNEEDEFVKTVEINKKGVTNSRDTKAYSDTEQSNPVMNIPFATEIFVFEKQGEMYQIKYKEKEYFLSEKDVELIDLDSLETVDINRQEMQSILPENLLDSYEFFLAHLNLGYDEVNGNLRGATAETVLNNRKTLEYAYDNILFRFNEEDVADNIIISNINNSSDVLETINKKAQLNSDDNTLYFIKTNRFVYTIDLLNNKLTIELR